MTRFHVFDCGKATGIALTVPTELLAHMAACVLTVFTGRFHDYASVRAFSYTERGEV